MDSGICAPGHAGATCLSDTESDMSPLLEVSERVLGKMRQCDL